MKWKKYPVVVRIVDDSTELQKVGGDHLLERGRNEPTHLQWLILVTDPTCAMAQTLGYFSLYEGLYYLVVWGWSHSSS